VAFAVDANASKQADQAAGHVKSTEGDFAKIAEQLGKLPGGKVIAGQSGLVSNVSTFGGLQVSEVAKLAKGQVSGVIKSTTDDGYYFVKVLDKNDTHVSFAYLHIPLTTFNSSLAQLKKDGKITEYIKLTGK
jgi:parvulin-like peptidyl-prolyl isomerase